MPSVPSWIMQPPTSSPLLEPETYLEFSIYLRKSLHCCHTYLPCFPQEVDVGGWQYPGFQQPVALLGSLPGRRVIITNLSQSTNTIYPNLPLGTENYFTSFDLRGNANQYREILRDIYAVTSDPQETPAGIANHETYHYAYPVQLAKSTQLLKSSTGSLYR